MVKLIVIKNPFQPWENRIIKDFNYGITYKEIINEAGLGNIDINVNANGEAIDIDYESVVNDNDVIVISPVIGKSRGGKILATVIGIALTVVGGMAASGAILGLEAETSTAALVGAGFGIAGSMLISVSQAMYAKSIGKANYETSTNDATYSWSGVQTTEGQNNPITMTYGRLKSGGQTIGKYVNVVDNKSYLNWLVSAGEGELEISDIKINDNEIGYYKGDGDEETVIVETRSGTNDQTVISNFNDTYFTQPLYYQLLETERIHSAQGNATEGLIVQISFPSGLFYTNDKGELDNAWVDLSIAYRLKGATEWNDFVSKNKSGLKLVDAPNYISLANSNAPLGTYEYRRNYSGVVVTDRIIYPDGHEVSTEWNNSLSKKVCGDFYVECDYSDPDYYDEEFYQFDVEKDDGVSNERIEAKQSSALNKEYRIDNLPAGEYEVKIKVLNRSHETNNARASVRCDWVGLTSIVYDDFTYPNIALLGIKALATDQLNGTPKLTFIKERKFIHAYNPVSKAYEQKPSNNPAWACYDMLHLCSRLMNINTKQYEYEVRGVPAKNIIYEQFEQWAKFCDEKNLKINIEITQCGEMLETINGQLACCGRGNVIRFGTRYGCIWECVRQPVQMFGMGNITSGTFTEEFLDISERANCIELTYNDENMDYERNVITIYGDNYDTDAEERISQITYNGITNYEQAYREGIYHLNCNAKQIRTVSFEANIDAIGCTVGDVVLVAHDVPQWAYSGRIEDVNVQENSITLPITIEEQGEYRIMYRTINDNLYTIGIDRYEQIGDYCKVYLKEGFDNTDPPQKYDVFDIALVNIGSKPFIVKSITRSQEFTRRITCIEYNESVFNEDYNVPEIDYSMLKQDVAKNVLDLNANQITYVGADGIKHSRLYVSWRPPDNGGRFTVMLSKDNKQWDTLISGTEKENYNVDVEYGSAYYVKVVTVLGLSVSNGVTTGLIRQGADIVPPNVKALYANKLKNGLISYTWDFDYPDPDDIQGFKLRYIMGSEPDWENGLNLNNGFITEQPFESFKNISGTYTVMIKAVDNGGHQSDDYASCIINFGDVLEENVLQKITLGNGVWSSTEATVTYSNAIIDTDGSLKATADDDSRLNGFWWSNQTSYFWKDNKDGYFWINSFLPLKLNISFTAKAEGYFWLNADCKNVSIKCSIGNNEINANSKTLVRIGDVVNIEFNASGVSNRPVINNVKIFVDVPDIEQSFNNLAISNSGTTLPIQLAHYETANVNVSSVTVDDNNAMYDLEIVSRKPCIIKINKITIVNNRVVKTPVNCVANIVWQGYENKTIGG